MLVRLIKDTRGTAAMEFGMVATLLFPMIFGGMEAGRLLFTQNAVQYAAESATREALVMEEVDETAVKARVMANLPNGFLSPKNVKLNVTFPTVANIDFVRVSGTYTYEALMPFLPESWSSMTLSLNSDMPLPKKS